MGEIFVCGGIYVLYSRLQQKSESTIHKLLFTFITTISVTSTGTQKFRIDIKDREDQTTNYSSCLKNCSFVRVSLISYIYIYIYITNDILYCYRFRSLSWCTRKPYYDSGTIHDRIYPTTGSVIIIRRKRRLTSNYYHW